VAAEGFKAHGSGCRPWFQIDREGDARSILRWAIEGGHWLTVRAAWDRRIRREGDTPGKLWATIEGRPLWGRYSVGMKDDPNRQARTALMELRAAEVTLDLGHPRAHADNKILVTLFAVLVRETETTPRDETPIEWFLLTTYPVVSFDDAQAVVHGYTQRWRIE